MLECAIKSQSKYLLKTLVGVRVGYTLLDFANSKASLYLQSRGFPCYVFGSCVRLTSDTARAKISFNLGWGFMVKNSISLLTSPTRSKASLLIFPCKI